MNTYINEENLTLPHFDRVKNAIEREIVQIFLNALNHSDQQSDVLYAIDKTSSLTGNSDALVAKLLVDNGLKAPRDCFPSDFLKHVDHIAEGQRLNFCGNINQSFRCLISFWNGVDDACISVISTTGCVQNQLYATN